MSIGLLKKRINEYNNIKEDLIPSIPKNMLLEVTNICNHNCIFCANSKSSRKKGLINENFAKKILKEAYELGTREVGFYSTGEPLVNKNLEIYIKEAKNIGYTYTYITTNGALLDKQRAETIINSGIDSIKFSINAGNIESYKFIHGRDDFANILNNLKYLYNYRKENEMNFKIYISCILTKYTKEEKELVNNVFGPYSDEIVFLNCKNQCGVMYEVNDNLTIDQEDKIEKAVCPLPFNKLHVTYEGYLTACCADFQNYLAIADLNKISLKEAWASNKFQELRLKHIEDNLKGTLCFNCMKNVDSPIEPLTKQLSTIYKKSEFSKADEIQKRIETFKNTVID